MRVRNVEVGKLIGESSKLRIYLGKEDDQDVILKIAKTFEDNDILVEEAKKLNLFLWYHNEVEKLSASLNLGNYGYNLLFANLHASFMEPSQGDRRINVLTFPEIGLDKLTPLTKLSSETEIDVRTSVWILGRLLKFYSISEAIPRAEDENTRVSSVAQYPIFSPDDYLIGPANHRLIYYNFSGDIDDVMANDFVKTITRFIMRWVLIDENDQSQQEYFKLLKDFEKNGRKSIDEAHKDLYDLVRKLWGIQYHPFTYRERNTINWKTIKE